MVSHKGNRQSSLCSVQADQTREDNDNATIVVSTTKNRALENQICPLHIVLSRFDMALGTLEELGVILSNRRDLAPYPQPTFSLREIRNCIDRASNDLARQGLPRDQEMAAVTVHTVLSAHPGCEVYCDECAHFLNQAMRRLGIHAANLTVVSAKGRLPDGNPVGHAFLLYANAPFGIRQSLDDHFREYSHQTYLLIDAWMPGVPYTVLQGLTYPELKSTIARHVRLAFTYLKGPGCCNGHIYYGRADPYGIGPCQEFNRIRVEA
ncbi:hypothetical protein [Cupriavidus necator]